MIWLIGNKGMLGTEVEYLLKTKGLPHIATDQEVDITKIDELREFIAEKPISLIINCAAYTAVDKAEAEQDLAFKINADGPRNIAEIAQCIGVKLIHISTDYVFDGLKPGPYLETDPVCPIGVYGKSKAEGEEKIRSILKEHIIIRTSWLYGIHGNNFVKTMLRLGKEKEELGVVDDQYGCPTYAADLAVAILNISSMIHKGQKTSWGTYHYCGCGSTTWFGFASKIFEIAKDYEELKLKKLIPINTSEYLTAAERPKNSIMSCSLLGTQFSIANRYWADSLKTMLDEYYRHIVL